MLEHSLFNISHVYDEAISSFFSETLNVRSPLKQGRDRLKNSLTFISDDSQHVIFHVESKRCRKQKVSDFAVSLSVFCDPSFPPIICLEPQSDRRSNNSIHPRINHINRINIEISVVIWIPLSQIL